MGKQRFASEPYISVDDDCYTHVCMHLNKDPDENTYSVTFSAFVRRMGEHMNATQMQKVADETLLTALLLQALETVPFKLTCEEYNQWAKEICNLPDETQNNAQTVG